MNRWLIVFDADGDRWWIVAHDGDIGRFVCHAATYEKARIVIGRLEADPTRRAA